MIPDIVCYEKQDTVGGMWNITWRTGLDKYAEHSHPSMYHDLWINSPICVNEYPDYTYEEHFGKILPSYVTSPLVRDYIEGRLTRGSERNLRQYIRFATVVKRVEYVGDTDEFKVVTKNLREDKEEISNFSHVVVASGQYTIPNIPEVPGIDSFKGRVLHSKDVRHMDEYKGQRILMVGSYLSADDLAVMAVKFGAQSVIVSYKYRPHGFKWPKGIEERPLLVKVNKHSCFFKDGSTAEVDVIMFCTGYKLEFPFLSEELRLKTKMLYYPENLYKGILWMNGGNNKLLYIGMQYNPLYFVTYDCQAVWATKFITGKIQLPSREEMKADISNWVKKCEDSTKNHLLAEYMVIIEDYYRHMVESAGYTTEALKLLDCFQQVLKHRYEDISTWRDKQFKCVYTGSLSPPLTPVWMDNFDESVEDFIKKY